MFLLESFPDTEKLRLIVRVLHHLLVGHCYCEDTKVASLYQCKLPIEQAVMLGVQYVVFFMDKC